MANLLALLPAKPQPRHTAEFHPGHVVEEHVRVYLRLAEDGSGWEIDPITFDGWPLEGLTTYKS